MVVLASRTVRQQICVCPKPLSLWYFVKKALGNPYTNHINKTGFYPKGNENSERVLRKGI